jgi:hypothetical protein
MITVNIATYSKREKHLQYVVDQLRNQSVKPDLIRIYSNDYIPTVEGAQVTVGKDHADNSKFYWKPQPGEIYFSCDDDLCYPNDYIEKTLYKLSQYPECIVSYHGRKLKAKGINYYAGHEWVACLGRSDEDKIIDVPGTGVMAFNADYFDISKIYSNRHRKMVDLVVGLEAARQQVEVVALEHREAWILDIPYDEGIYLTARYNQSKQIALADKIFDCKYS